jgi:hypothetical protein
MSVKQRGHQISDRKRRDRPIFQFVPSRSDLKVCAVWLRLLVPIDRRHYYIRVLVTEYGYIIRYVI